MSKQIMKGHSLIEGSIKRGIIQLLIPILVSYYVQQLYSTIDIILIGRYAGAKAAAAIGSSNLIVTCIIVFFNGMGVGASVITANAFGENNKLKIRQIIQTVLMGSMVSGTILMILGILLAPKLLDLMGTPFEIKNDALIYLRMYFLSVVSIISYNLMSGILRAMGDSKIPMYVQLICSVMNLIGDTIFIVGLRKGIWGAAITTFIAQTTASLILFAYLSNKKNFISMKSLKNGFSFNLLLSILSIGIPSGLQSMVITFSNILIQTKINQLGVAGIAAYTNYFKIELLIYYPILALGQTVITFIGQNLGARRWERIKKGMKFSIIFGIVMTLMFSILVILYRERLASLFTTDSKVIHNVGEIISTTVPYYFLYVIYECLACKIRGFAKPIPAMLVTIISFSVIRIILLNYIFQYWKSVKSIAVVYPLSWSVAVVLLLIIDYIYHCNNN